MLKPNKSLVFLWWLLYHFLKHQTSIFSPPKKGFFSPLSDTPGGLSGLFIAWSNTDYLFSLGQSHWRTTNTFPSQGAGKAATESASPQDVHCWPCWPLNVQSLAQCLAQSTCLINKLFNAHTWSEIQLLVLHINPWPLIYRCTCTRASTYAHTVPLHVPHHPCPSTHIPGPVKIATWTHHPDHIWSCRSMLDTEHPLHHSPRPLSSQGLNPLGGKKLASYPETPDPWMRQEFLWRLTSQKTDRQ